MLALQEGNWIYDAGDAATAALDHSGIGEGCHCPGGLYSDEGTCSGQYWFICLRT
jgi:hypothetical protein